MQARMLSFLDSHPDCLYRTLAIGHFTASAWVVDVAAEAVLLIHHRKLGRWLQPGGHADGDSDLLAVAQREAWEETGLVTSPVTQALFDMDIHEIPARGNEAAHVHYDVRFWLSPVEGARLALNHEVMDSRWIPLRDVHTLCQDRSILRMVDKSMVLLPLIAGKNDL